MLIRIEGPRTQVFVNEVKVTDYTEGQPVPAKKVDYEPNRGPRPEKGWIGLQNHSDKDTVYFKSISVLATGLGTGLVRIPPELNQRCPSGHGWFASRVIFEVVLEVVDRLL